MAYPYYNPVNYNPTFYPSYTNYSQSYAPQSPAMPQQQQTAQQTAQAQHPSIQQSGFVLVQSEQEARSYPVAPGNSITFKDETAPFCYVKTMGFNQLDRPIFEKYRLVKEDAPSDAKSEPATNERAETGKNTDYATKSDVDAIWDELDALKEKLKATAEKKAVKTRKIEVETEDEDDE